MQADDLTHAKDFRRLSPASTAALLISLLFANKLWILDATSMSLYWVARLPIERPKATSPLAPRQTARTGQSDEVPPIPVAPTVSTRHRKIALSLAVLGATAAPFVFGTYKAKPIYVVQVPLTDQIRDLRRYFVYECKRQRRVYCEEDIERAAYERRLDLPKYLALNGGVAVTMFASVFALALLIPLMIRGCASLARRYWDWLNA